MLARYFLQRLYKDTKHSGEFEYPSDLIEHEYRLLSVVTLNMEFLFWRVEVNIWNKFLKWSVKKWCVK